MTLVTPVLGFENTEEVRFSFSIPQQRADLSLTLFAEQADVTLVFPYDLLREKTANDLQGSYPIQTAANKLLEGTGLRSEFSDQGILTISAIDSRPVKGKQMSVKNKVGFMAMLASAFVGAGVSAQQDGSSDAAGANETLEEVIVTGSRVARSGFDTPTPTTVISSQEIARTGMNDIGQILQQVPQIGVGLGASNDTFNRDIGSSFINLRGLGENRTLVLIDGRRRVSGSRDGSQVDLTAIPASMIESVEIITGGASAIYGADAVSGVVNVKLKKDFEGLVLNARAGTSQEGDGETFSISLHGGGMFAADRGSANFGVTVQENRPIFQVDRPYSFGDGIMSWVNNPDNTGPADGIPDRIAINNPHSISITYDPNFVVDGTRYVYDGSLRPIGNQTCYGTTCAGGPDGYNNNERLLRTPRDVISAMSTIEYDLTDNVKLFSGLDFSFAETVTNGQSFFDSALVLERENPTIPAEVLALMDANGLTTLGMGIQQQEKLGNKEYENSRYTYTANIGLKGRIADRFDWETFYQYGRRSQKYQIANTRIESRFFEAIDVITDPVTGDPVCRSAEAVAAGCLPIDMFRTAPATEMEKAYFSYAFSRDVSNEQTLAGFQISGDLFELPAGNMSVAAGAEYRKDTLTAQDDGLGARGLLYRTDNGGGSMSASADVTELFVEAVTPILKDAPLARELSIEAALRWSDYNTIGSAVAWKLGANWSPTDSLRFRYTQSQSVRAPNILELFGPESRGTLNITADPCDVASINQSPTREANCRALGVPVGWIDPASTLALLTVLGGNAELRQEESDSWSAGLIFSPESIAGLRLSMDYWSIEISDAIQTINGNDIVDNCVDSPTLDNVFCPLVTRGNFVGIADDYVISRIDLRQVNVGLLEAAGIDLAADYRFPLDSIVSSWPGEMSVRLSLVHLSKLEELVDPSEPSSLLIEDGEYDDPTWRGGIGFAYTMDNLSVDWDIRYIGDSRVDVQVSDEYYSLDRVPSMSYHDLFVNYELPSDIQVNFGINNVFDNHPPRNPATYRGAFDGSLYDNIGRFFFVGTSVRF
ncbi:MAG: TonB-dependent receptor [Woeseia sp.]